MPPRVHETVNNDDLVLFARQNWSSIPNNHILYVMRCIVIYHVIYDEAPPYEEISQRPIKPITTPPSTWYNNNLNNYKVTANTLRSGHVTSDVLATLDLQIREHGNINDLRRLALYEKKDQDQMMEDVAIVHANIVAYSVAYGISFMKGYPRKKFSSFRPNILSRWPALRNNDTAFMRDVFKPEYLRTLTNEDDDSAQASAAAQHELQPSQPDASPVRTPGGSRLPSPTSTPPRVAMTPVHGSPGEARDDESVLPETPPATPAPSILVRQGSELSMSRRSTRSAQSSSLDSWGRFFEELENTAFTDAERAEADAQMSAFITRVLMNMSSNSDIQSPDRSS